MDDDEMKKKLHMITSICICSSCPSWVACDEKGAYCQPTIGKSKCITEENGCICGGCPVTEKMGLNHIYYCTKGSEKEQISM